MTEDPRVTLFEQARVARLGTVTPTGPRLVPIVFAVTRSDGDLAVVTAVDGKPKSTTALRRLADIAAAPSVTVLADHYDEDWTALWWVRLDGAATVHPIDSAVGVAAVHALRRKYPQYGEVGLPGPVIRIRPRRWSGWRA